MYNSVGFQCINTFTFRQCSLIVHSFRLSCSLRSNLATTIRKINWGGLQFLWKETPSQSFTPWKPVSSNASMSLSKPRKINQNDISTTVEKSQLTQKVEAVPGASVFLSRILQHSLGNHFAKQNWQNQWFVVGEKTTSKSKTHLQNFRYPLSHDVRRPVWKKFD